MNVVARQVRLAAGLSRNARLFLLMGAINGLGNGIFMLFLNLFILARGNDEAFLGLLMSTMSLSSLVLGLPMGLLTDRMGRKRAMLLGSVASILAVLLLLLSPADGLLVFAAFILGGGQALYMAAGPAFMAENTTDDQRATLFSLNQSIMMLVSFAGSALGGPLPGLFAALLGTHPEGVVAYRATLLLSEGLMACSVIPLLLIEEEKRSSTSSLSSRRPSLKMLFLRKDLYPLLIPQLIIGLGAAMLIPYLNIFFKRRFGVSDSLLGVIFAGSQLLVGGATLLTPILAERWGKIRTVVITELASLPFLFALGFVPVLPIAMAAFWIRAMLMNMGNPLYTAFAMEQIPEDERGTVGSLLGIVWSVGWGIGPGISGFIQRNAGFTPLFLFTGSTYLVAALMIQALFGREEAGHRTQGVEDEEQEEKGW